MNKDEYVAQLEEMVDEISDDGLSELVVNRLAGRCVELQRNIDFTLDEIYEELEESTPARILKLDWFADFLLDIANLVFDEAEELQEEEIDEE